jgi:hypothetical protein
MHNSGVIDFQSHSMYHHSISRSHQVLDFVNPHMRPSLFDDFVPLFPAEGRAKELHELDCGTPILDWAPRFSASRAFHESPDTVLACVEHVNRYGGEEYFQNANWRSQLEAVITDARKRNPGSGYETTAGQRQSIKDDLINSRQMIESRLPGKKVEHFCYPWFHGSALSIEISAETGYISNAWGSLLPPFAKGHDQTVHIPRIPPAYLWRLPGKGRKPLKDILRTRLPKLYWN